MKHSPYNPLTWLASLRLTVTLLAMSMYLIFVGTLAQVENGIWQVVEQYFRSVVVMVPFDVFRSLIYPGSTVRWDYAHPFPGGYTLIGLLVVNLLAAHAMRYKVMGKGKTLLAGYGLILLGSAVAGYTVLEPQTSATIQQNVMLMLAIWSVPMAVLAVGCLLVFGKRKAGIVLVHGGLILMLLGEFITGIGATEGRMLIPEFGSSNVILDTREAEIAFVQQVDDNNRKHIVIPESILVDAEAKDKPIQDPQLPLSVRVDKWMDNSTLATPDFNSKDPTDLTWNVMEDDPVTGTEQSEDRPSAVVTFYRGDQRVAQHTLSTWPMFQPVSVEVDGEVWDVSLRFKHNYLPYSIQLHDFRNDQFTGTTIPSNYSADLRLAADALGDTRDTFIKMNQPLRYDGKAFFQAGFFSQPMNRNLGTILQVADNPGAWVPYLSCVIVTLGLTLHFVLSLIQFGRRANAKTNTPKSPDSAHKLKTPPAQPA